MNCRRAEKWLSMALDGELPLKRETVLREHLAQCPSCRALEKEWASFSQVLRSRAVPQAQTAEAAWADVRRAIRLQKEPREREQEIPAWDSRLRWASAMLAVLLLGVGLVLVVRQKPMAGAGMARAGSTEVEWVETSLPGATPMVYEDKESGFTVIWIVGANHDGKAHVGT